MFYTGAQFGSIPLDRQINFQNKVSLCVSFIDLKYAFDSIFRKKLWETLRATSVDKRLLSLIQVLYTHNTIRVRSNMQALLTNFIPTNKGVKQGCVLSPTLFAICINDLISHLQLIDTHARSSADWHLIALLFADYTILLPEHL